MNISAIIRDIPKAILLRPYYRFRGSMPIWRFLNWKGRSLYRRNPPRHNAVSQRIVADLQRDGIAISHLDELFPGERVLESFFAHLKEHELEERAAQSAKKAFFLDMWDPERFFMNMRDPFVRFALDRRIIDIAGSYLGMYLKLQALRAMKTVVVQEGQAATQSQLWHRDPDDNRLCKVFVYLHDVLEESTGPFMYVAGSQPGGRWGNVFPQLRPFTPGNPRITDEVLSAQVPAAHLKMCTGKAGTIIFVDTVGLHKGGYSTARSRFTFLTSFCSAIPYTRPPRRKKIICPPGFARAARSLGAPAEYAVSHGLSTYLP